MNSVLTFIRTNFMTFVALCAAIVTCIFIPPDAEYLNYIDVRTIACLFGTLAVVCALKNIGFFYNLAQEIVVRFKTTRLCILVLVLITYFGSMLLANDMALITFLPLGYYVLSVANKNNYMAFTFIIQSIAANLGGMLTPFGNPQNIYLFSKFNISNGEFLSIMFPPFIAATLLILCCCAFVRSEPVKIIKHEKKTDKKRAIVYGILFCVAVGMVVFKLDFIVCLIIIAVTLVFLDYKALLNVDYPLLLTFVFFFVFAGNMARIPQVNEFISGLLQKDTLLFSVLSCQCISNVPSAILLSRFTDDYASLLIGVNIGGVGTLISSLANLITFREYIHHNPGKGFYYVGLFSLFNFGFLFFLVLFMIFIRNL